MKAKIDNCDYCGGRVVEKLTAVDLRLEGKLYVFENVPVGICTEVRIIDQGNVPHPQFGLDLPAVKP